ncbi:hypothetical protein NO559_04565 [Dasania sp. GY-MA-18]|uniref:STAS/SEC14 domain-containing protein n=1 Tax=Dasania phycosphaerae TaxID=2950436 RepID=A0A9J6RJ97_9GAMM|nr:MULTISPECIES: hypothetical protein [Dasania]MCR8922030.1 hypothetical protein [Dasania sp. GY-MA-18]MCZ0864458.1 hypothetical protein [Dasania phycosphaerae]MCZ0868186.1 hypothetical protein [Dasania phycosphaerae]
MDMLVKNNIFPIQEYSLSFGNFQFFADYVCCEINEGVDLDEAKLLQFYALCSDVFQGERFAVIELRLSSFSVDPSFYIKHSYLLSQVKAHAMVLAGGTFAQLSEFEAQCIKHCPCRVFHSLSEAIDWVTQQA